MSVKLTLLKSNEIVISNLKEVRSSDKLVGYMFNRPNIVTVTNQQKIFLNEGSSDDKQEESEREIEVSMTPWVFLTSDEDFLVPIDWIVTIMEPVEDIVKMYEEKVNGIEKGQRN